MNREIILEGNYIFKVDGGTTSKGSYLARKNNKTSFELGPHDFAVPFHVKQCVGDNMEGVYNVKCLLPENKDGRIWLSCTKNGKKVDLWKEDDDSGRQKWLFVKRGNEDYFNIRVFSGIKNKRVFLSCTKNGHTVDLYDEDDDSGRQRWLMQMVQIGPCPNINKDQIEQLKVIFKKMDKDRDGRLDKDEMEKLIKKLNPKFTQMMCQQYVEKAFKGLDADGDGFVSFDEYVKFVGK